MLDTVAVADYMKEGPIYSLMGLKRIHYYHKIIALMAFFTCNTKSTGYSGGSYHPRAHRLLFLTHSK